MKTKEQEFDWIKFFWHFSIIVTILVAFFSLFYIHNVLTNQEGNIKFNETIKESLTITRTIDGGCFVEAIYYKGDGKYGYSLKECGE